MHNNHTMAASTSTTAMALPHSPLACFLAGMLVPTIAFYFLGSNPKERGTAVIDVNDDGEWDDDEDDESEDHDADHPLQNKNNPSASWSIMDAPYKMVLCVNQDLGMGKGT